MRFVHINWNLNGPSGHFREAPGTKIHRPSAIIAQPLYRDDLWDSLQDLDTADIDSECLGAGEEIITQPSL